MTDYGTMRRKDRISPEGEAEALLERGEYGILSMVGPDGQPYGIPLSYVVVNGAVCFHCALKGRKIDHLAAEGRVSFTVVDQTELVHDPKTGFGTYYESAVVFGNAAPVTNEAERTSILLALCEKYFPGQREDAQKEIDATGKATGVYKIEILHLSGKMRKKP